MRKMADVLRPESGGNPRAAQTRIAHRNATSIGGQRAHDLRMGPQPSYVDADRSKLNRMLLEPMTGTKLRAICEERRSQRETKLAMKSSASVGVAGIITFGHEAQQIFDRLTPEQQDAAYLETAKTIAARLNTTLTGLVVHVDESAPHAHFQLPAYDLSGHPISETAKRGALRDLQTITAEVMGRHAPGIERGNSKQDRLKAGASPAEVVNRSVAQLHDDLPAEIATKEAELSKIQAKLQTNLERLAKARTQAAEEGDKADKAQKRAETYEKRVQVAQNELNELEAALNRLRASQEDLEAKNQKLAQSNEVKAAEARSLDSELAQKKTTIETLRSKNAAFELRKAALEAKLRTLSAA